MCCISLVKIRRGFEIALRDTHFDPYKETRTTSPTACNLEMKASNTSESLTKLFDSSNQFPKPGILILDISL